MYERAASMKSSSASIRRSDPEAFSAGRNPAPGSTADVAGLASSGLRAVMSFITRHTSLVTLSCLAASQHGVEREAAGSGHVEHQESADDREVLEELALLQTARRRVGEIPVTVRNAGRDDHEEDHQQRRVACLEPGDDQDAAHEFDGRADHRPERRGGNPAHREAGGEGAEGHELLEPALDE